MLPAAAQLSSHRGHLKGHADLKRLVQAAAPARVTIVGEHTDHQEGLTLLFTIDRWAACTAAVSSNDQSTIRSANLGTASSTDRDDGRSAWANLFWALAERLCDQGDRPRAFDLVLESDILSARAWPAAPRHAPPRAWRSPGFGGRIGPPANSRRSADSQSTTPVCPAG